MPEKHLEQDQAHVGCGENVSHSSVSLALQYPLALTPGHESLLLCSWYFLHPRQVLANKSHLWIEEEVWRMEIYLSLGVLAFGTLSLLAVTSLPSIANSLNWREFSFVQVKQFCLCW